MFTMRKTGIEFAQTLHLTAGSDSGTSASVDGSYALGPSHRRL